MSSLNLLTFFHFKPGGSILGTMRRIHLLLFLSVTLMAGAWIAGAPAEKSKPNLLFIAVDDLNDWIGVSGGHPDVKTPHMDRLAKRGVLFTRAYAAAPACNPSRAALLTGIRPSTSGVYHNSQPWRPALPKAVTLPQHFMAHGYHVAGGGKIFHDRFNDQASWQEYIKRTADPEPSPEVLKDPHSRAGGIVWGVLDSPDKAMGDHRLVSWAGNFLGKEHDKPFFLAVGISKPHMPWRVPRKYYDMYPLDQIKLPEVPSDDLSDVPAAGIKMARPERDHADVLQSNNWRYAVQAYLASISFADAQIGRLLDVLDQSSYRDNTIIVLWGDHGWHLGEKHHWRKFALWEEATRTPLILVAPGVTKAGSVCERPMDFMHIYPTVAELCGLPVGSHLEGVSFVPLLKDPKAPWERPAVMTHGRNNHAVRSERWRYIRYADGSEELYDHQSDPMEWKNLATDPKHTKIKAELAAWLPKTNAPDAPQER